MHFEFAMLNCVVLAVAVLISLAAVASKNVSVGETEVGEHYTYFIEAVAAGI